MTDLNKLIGTATDTFHLDSAVAVNDNGQIVATPFVESHWNTSSCLIDTNYASTI